MQSPFSFHKTVSVRILASVILCALPGLVAWHIPALPEYAITDLGTLGGAESAATAMNDYGQVVGWAGLPDGTRHAFLYSGGSMRDLGTLTGGTNSIAASINELGQVTGYSGINEFGPGFREVEQGFIWDQGEMHSIGALFCPCSFNDRYGTSSGFDINDFGLVAGASQTVRGSWVLHAMLWQNGQLQDLGGGAGDWSVSRVFALNDAGQMVGDYARDAGLLGTLVFNREASLWQNGMRQGLGTLDGDTSSTALDVNGRGEVVGWSGTADASQSHAFLWNNGNLRDLGTLPGDANSAALAINARGIVVGWSGAAEGSGSRAFLWRRGRMVDLNEAVDPDSGWVLTEAHAIDNVGRIAGTGLHNGQAHAFLLTPPNAMRGRR